ncbi:hypothetical protein AVEN_101154-1 [Araneus ventricosus]|uniref:Uncharacterized protein n=1 Tax=Araneus ventricosus TaxID=182803 RepID=A0A4Y2DG30_ARAVE|nr:hypothetical protein AVEN_101154-1 [Araneus ventricosus]
MSGIGVRFGPFEKFVISQVRYTGVPRSRIISSVLQHDLTQMEMFCRQFVQIWRTTELCSSSTFMYTQLSSCQFRIFIPSDVSHDEGVSFQAMKENGFARGVYCAEQLPEMDLELFFEIMNTYYPGTTELLPLTEQICANFERGVEAISNWYEEKRYRNIIYTTKQAQAVVNSRACFFLMVTECELKKALGFFG